MAVKEELTTQLNKGWIDQRKAKKTWNAFEEQHDQKYIQGPPRFGRR